MPMMNRRLLLALASSASLLLGACASQPEKPSLQQAPVIVFVHGNGDTAATWTTTEWRFTSNGWPQERLIALDQPYPIARDNDGKAEPGRSSTADSAAWLAAEVDKALAATGASQVVLMANSRGGLTIRNYIANGGGAAKVSMAILGGTPNHGVIAVPGVNEVNEFSGTGPFLKALNAPKNAGGDEVTGPVRWLTLRSDGNDKYAQPDGVWINARGKATNIDEHGPELKGATNVVLPGVDHRETAYSAAAFAAAYQFITGQAPATKDVAPQTTPIVVNGKVNGLGLKPDDPASGNFTDNLPLPGAEVTIYATNPDTGERLGAPVHQKKTGADGLWGPFTAQAGLAYEFVISAPGYAITHIYRSGFPRSSPIVHLRAERLPDTDKGAGSVVTWVRPRGYFDPTRYKMLFDGHVVPPGVPASGTAGVASSKLKLEKEELRSIKAEFNGEKLVGQTWPASQGHMVMLELTY
jgi:pimeloyl-ACP methyl ester carboxylesterase